MLKVVFEMRKVSVERHALGSAAGKAIYLWTVRHQDVMEVIRDSR